MASSDSPASQSSGSRFAGTRSRQAGRRGRAAVRSLRHLPPSVVLLTGLLAGLAVFQLLRAAQQAEIADALADWAGACARLEEAYGTDSAMRIEALRIRTVGKSSGPFAAGEIPHPPVPGTGREKQPSGSASSSALPGDPSRSQAFAARPSYSSRTAPAILRFLSDASPEDPVITRKPSPAQEAGTFPLGTDLIPPGGMPAVSSPSLPETHGENAESTAAALMNARTVPDEDARAFLTDSPLLHAAGTPESGADVLVLFSSPSCPACQALSNLIREKASELRFPVFIAPAGDTEAAARLLAPEGQGEKFTAALGCVRRNTAFAESHLGRVRLPAALWVTPSGARMATLGGSSFAVLAGALNIRAARRAETGSPPPDQAEPGPPGSSGK